MGEIARELSQNRWRELSPRFESLARVGSHVSPQNPEIGPRRPCVRCAAFEITRLASIRLPRGTAEWLAKVGRVRSTLAIGDWRSCPSKWWWVHPYNDWCACTKAASIPAWQRSETTGPRRYLRGFYDTAPTLKIFAPCLELGTKAAFC